MSFDRDSRKRTASDAARIYGIEGQEHFLKGVMSAVHRLAFLVHGLPQNQIDDYKVRSLIENEYAEAIEDLRHVYLGNNQRTFGLERDSLSSTRLCGMQYQILALHALRTAEFNRDESLQFFRECACTSPTPRSWAYLMNRFLTNLPKSKVKTHRNDIQEANTYRFLKAYLGHFQGNKVIQFETFTNEVVDTSKPLRLTGLIIPSSRSRKK